MRKASFQCIDAHTCGNPVRLIVSNAPQLEGATMGEKRLDFLAHHDWIRQALMFEPRGHDMMSGGFLYPAINADSDASILFVETSGCLPMCGHGTIGIVTAAIEHGYLQPKTPGQLTLDVPAGTIKVEYQQNTDGKVTAVKIFNVPSFLAFQDQEIDIEGFGKLGYDVAYGGNFYAIIEPQQNYPGLVEFGASNIVRWSPVIRAAIDQQLNCVHPLDSKVKGLSHLLWTGEPQNADSDAANAVFYGAKAIDRSPCGTGTSARMAQLFAKRQLQQNDTFVHESIIGSQFKGRIESTCEIGHHLAINPSIEGWAQVTGINTIFVDPADPYAQGFSVT
ncbi:4-hydroxyproline epimerase [Pleionea sp. CnH1-48]|uniref:4-hydroxyproline epimerase n=1 Tax=Pleionea sp. CnH1-48 TaxID=2954494 RepID=UPI00209694AC|nr:4-hydroxyproline epimerase [Pleionea sp. CnH1-48]MCO7223417.1 4-hydroxyproline epimerase [Pleionea sp. CnH1-48]